MHILASVVSLSDSLCTGFQKWISSQMSLIVFILYVNLLGVDRARIASIATLRGGCVVRNSHPGGKKFSHSPVSVMWHTQLLLYGSWVFSV